MYNMYIRAIYNIKHNVMKIAWQFQYLEFAHFENVLVILYLSTYTDGCTVLCAHLK